MSLLKYFHEIEQEELCLVGGKALSLGRMKRAGFNVPDGFVVTTECYKKAKGKEMDRALEDEIFKFFDSLGAKRVAVRSSAIAEDSSNASWAGQFESYLNVKRENLVASIKACWESASTDLVNSYAESQSIGKEKLAIAVVVQIMVDSEVSGVAFSVNPISKNENELMIESIYGLGELIVQGMEIPDDYIVDKSSMQILDKKVAHKTKMLVYKEGNNKEQPVLEEQSDTECLSDFQVLELTKIIIDIEKYYNSPQDVEWALENNKFYIVQSRPITTL